MYGIVPSGESTVFQPDPYMLIKQNKSVQPKSLR